MRDLQGLLAAGIDLVTSGLAPDWRRVAAGLALD
tara:strand:- start:1352 stop:1453 length:102 start_codon:yes stop_codon:yes gene_type:complete